MERKKAKKFFIIQDLNFVRGLKERKNIFSVWCTWARLRILKQSTNNDLSSRRCQVERKDLFLIEISYHPPSLISRRLHTRFQFSTKRIWNLSAEWSGSRNVIPPSRSHLLFNESLSFFFSFFRKFNFELAQKRWKKNISLKRVRQKGRTDGESRMQKLMAQKGPITKNIYKKKNKKKKVARFLCNDSSSVQGTLTSFRPFSLSLCLSIPLWLFCVCLTSSRSSDSFFFISSELLVFLFLSPFFRVWWPLPRNENRRRHTDREMEWKYKKIKTLC